MKKKGRVCFGITGLLASISILFLTFSCENDESEDVIGLNLIESDTYVEMIDTFSLQLSTVMMDSMSTSGNYFGLVGALNDDLTGNVQAETYFKLEWPETIKILDEEWCDSISLIINLSGLRLGDTTQYVDLFVHEVTQDYELPENGSFYYHNKLDYSTEAIGSLNFRPTEEDLEIEIPLNQAYTDELFELLKNRDYTVELDDGHSLQEYLKGLVLKTTPTDNLMFGLSFESSSTYIRVYIGKTTTETEQRYIDLSFSDYEYQFYHIEQDLSGTPFSGLVAGGEISSSVSDDLTLIRPSLGIFTKLKMSSIESIRQISEYGAVLKAELVLRPEEYRKQANDYPSDLFLYSADKFNVPDSIIQTVGGSVVTSSFTEDLYYNENTYYTFDVSDYIISELYDNYVDPDRSVLVSFGYGSDEPLLNSLILKGNISTTVKPVLKIYYLHL